MEVIYKRKIKSWMKDHHVASVDVDLIMEALTHSSYKGMGYDVKDNERLEFLGDAVLDLITAHQLFLDAQLSEGVMTEIRKERVNNETLARVFDAIEITELIRTANDFMLSVKNKADFVEALIGTIFIDEGYEKARQFWNKILPDDINILEKETDDIDFSKIELNLDGLKDLRPLSKIRSYKRYALDPNQLKNAKNALQEYCQKHGLSIPQYELINREGADHRPIFTSRVSLRAFVSEISEIGKGSSKKQSELIAAENACDFLGIRYIK